MQQYETYFKANQAHWDSRVLPHLSSELYDMEAFLKGESSLNSIELDVLNQSVQGKTLLHLQCHFGQDTLSWSRLGAKATGVDFSSLAIAKARELNATLDLDATFVETDIYSLPQHLEQDFDIVFTSYGCIVWLPDLDEWATIVAKYLKKGGIFLMADFHPTFMLFNFDNQKIEYDYFNRGVVKETQTHSYTGQPLETPATEYFWQHSLMEIIQSLLKNGLQLVDFQEFGYSPYQCFPNMRKQGDKNFVFGDFKVSFPHVFAIKAIKS
jgi:SAM-dependent methyltransferase